MVQPVSVPGSLSSVAACPRHILGKPCHVPVSPGREEDSVDPWGDGKAVGIPGRTHCSSCPGWLLQTAMPGLVLADTAPRPAKT